MKNLTKLMVISLSLFCSLIVFTGCSGDDGGPMGPDPIVEPPEPVDVFKDVTIKFDSLVVIEDCDFGTGMGDFDYDFYIDKKKADGDWIIQAYWAKDLVKIASRTTYKFSGLSKTVNMKQGAHQSLRVRLFLKEQDGILGTDLDVSTIMNHREGLNWGAGIRTWSIHTRDHAFLVEGCEMTLYYTTTVKKL